MSDLRVVIEKVANEDGWDNIDGEQVLARAIEAMGWDLIEQTSDTADREPSQETFREACKTAARIVHTFLDAAPRLIKEATDD